VTYMVSPRLREEFGNGEEFYPTREFLEWHIEEVLAS